MQRMTRVSIDTDELSGELALGPQPGDARLAKIGRKRTDARVDLVGGLRGRHRLPTLERQSGWLSGRFRIHSRFMEGVPPNVNFCSRPASDRKKAAGIRSWMVPPHRSRPGTAWRARFAARARAPGKRGLPP